MREIKFRFWDKLDKLWLYYPLLSKDGELLHCGTLGLMPIVDQYNVLVSQYTGLKDKNGKEIYEGDVLKYKLFSNENYFIGDVKYSEKSATFYISRCQHGDFRLISDRDDFEVVGNIYENPELLK